MQGRDTEGSERPRASHAYPLITCYSGSPSHRSVCPRTRPTRDPVARYRLVSYVLPPVSKILQIRGIPPKIAAILELLLWRRAEVTVFQEH
eukprot:3540892-Prymnesium_polylepis.1